MKNIFKIIFVSLLASQMAIALDLHTDKACASLKTAIQQAQSLEKVLDAWNKLVKGDTVSVQDRVHLATQIAAYAQEQKGTFEQELATLGNTTYNASQLKWATAQAAFGTWCIISCLKLLDGINKCKGFSDDTIDWILFPITSTMRTLMNHQAAIASAIFGIAIDQTAPYFFYKAARNLSHGLNYKNSIEEKIKNLTAAIEFISPWTDPVLGNQFEARNWGVESITV